MPRRIRSPKRRFDILTWEQTMNLIIGGRTIAELKRAGRSPAMITEGVFENDQERRAAWESHRERVIAGTNPETRPQAWYDYG